MVLARDLGRASPNQAPASVSLSRAHTLASNTRCLPALCPSNKHNHGRGLRRVHPERDRHLGLDLWIR
jgi:hypothetical protein